MPDHWRIERDGDRWRVVRLCDDGYRTVFSPSGDPDLGRFQTEAAARHMAATLNALDAEDCLRA
jgi:hypothetical protein